MNGVSKKLCMTAAGILAVTQLADDTANKLPYAIIIGILCVVYELVQGFIDKKSRGPETGNGQ